MKRKAPSMLLIVCMLFSSLIVGVPHSAFADSNGDTQNLLDNLFSNGGDGGVENRDEQGGQGTESEEEQSATVRRVVEEYYSKLLSEWEKANFDSSSYQTVIHPDQFMSGDMLVGLTPAAESEGYDEDVFTWNEQTPEIHFTVNVPHDGLYRIQIDYYALPGKITPPERGIQVGGAFPYFEARRIVFPRLWKNESGPFQRDGLGNDVYAKQAEVSGWQSAAATDASYLHDEPLLFYLKKGKSEIQLVYVREAMRVGRITVSSPEKPHSYESYLRKNGDAPKDMKVLRTYEAEKPYTKSDSYIQAMASGDINVTPRSSSLIRLNTIGGDSWKQGGQSVTWKIGVDQTGYYRIAFKYVQYLKKNMTVFRTVKLDGAVPFREMSAYAFPYAPDWENAVLADFKGHPYQFYLTAGEHELTLIADPSPYERVIRTVREVMEELASLTLEIRMATGNTQDINRDWDITEQMPDIVDRLTALAGRLREEYAYLRELSGTSPDDARNLLVGAEQLERLAQKPLSIPYRFKQLSEGSGSVNQKMGNLLLDLPKQDLQIDKFYVYANHELPKAKAGWWQKIGAIVQNFLISFTKDYSQINPDDGDTVRIWVNRSRQHVMLMQQIVNREFTAKTGIKVSLSLMPNEQKMILAGASGVSPDAALGVSEKYPYDLALRGALADLSRFEDYNDVLDRFAPGAMLPFMFDGGVYALPETQNFWVLYYRKDILDALSLEAPQTWDDVLNMLPDLQRYGMNFYVPIADTSALKSFSLTAPFIYQQGGELFADDGSRTAADSERALEGFKLMTKIFTVYNMPQQVANFYNHFRSGYLPVGISNYNTYVELTTAAPELAGWWKIAPYPGVRNEKGEIVRWTSGSGQSAVIFSNSDKQRQAWDFVQWWTSSEVQAEFGNLLETVYGPAYRWNTANLQAFGQLPWPEEDLRVIQEQWNWLKDVAHVPGDYMLDRELSNAWNKVVVDGKNPRKMLEEAAILANREIAKKLEEFGYMKDGKVIKKLQVPSIEDVIAARGESE